MPWGRYYPAEKRLTQSRQGIERHVTVWIDRQPSDPLVGRFFEPLGRTGGEGRHCDSDGGEQGTVSVDRIVLAVHVPSHSDLPSDKRFQP